MLIRLLLLFTVVPLLEFWILWTLAARTSVLMTVCVVLVTGVVGTLLARLQGFRTLSSIQQSLASGQLPTDALWDAAMIFVAGALLLTPGLLTDTLGLTLLLPLCRAGYRRWIKGWFRRNFQIHDAYSDPPNRSEIIDVQVRRSDESEP